MLNCCESDFPAGPTAAKAAIVTTAQNAMTSRLWLRIQLARRVMISSLRAAFAGCRSHRGAPSPGRQDLLPFLGSVRATAAGSLGCLWLLCACLHDVALGLRAPSGMP